MTKKTIHKGTMVCMTGAQADAIQAMAIAEGYTVVREESTDNITDKQWRLAGLHGRVDWLKKHFTTKSNVVHIS